MSKAKEQVEKSEGLVTPEQKQVLTNLFGSLDQLAAAKIPRPQG